MRNMMEAIKRFISWKYGYLLFYAVLSILILSKLLFPGYVLTLDMIFTPNTYFEKVVYGWNDDQNGRANTLTETPRLPYFFVVYLLNFVLPLWMIQKLILFLILFLSGISAYQLCPTERPYGKYFAGLLYLINPFTYVRFLAGHYLLLLAYAITPFAVKALMDAFDTGNKQNVIKAALWVTLVGVLNLHNLVLVLFLFGVFFVVNVVQNRKDRKKFLDLIRTTGLVTGIFFLLNIYWLLPILTESTGLSQIVSTDIMVFAPQHTSNFNIAFTIFSMYGFWRGGYIYVKDILPFWYLIFIFMFFLAIHGAVTTFSDKRLGTHTKAFIIVIIVAAVIAIGAASPLTAPVFNWLFDHLFFFRGFRDSQKFVALLVLAYAYLGGLGLDDFTTYLKERNVKSMIAVIIVIIALVSPPLYSYTMFGFHDQLNPMDYPQGWYEANDFLNHDPEDCNVLFFPWHLYMTFSWSERRIANPAGSFFDTPVIQGDNIEAGPIYSQSTSQVSKYIEFLLRRNNEYSNFGELVAPLNVKYIILAKEADHKQYDFLHEQEDLEVVLENENLVVFENGHETTKIYEVNHAYAIRDWNDLLEQSRTQDITNAAYLIADNTLEEQVLDNSEKGVLNYSRERQVEYVLEDTPTKKYVIFTASYSQDWKYGSQRPLNNLGLTNAFETDNFNAGRIWYNRFWVFLLGYVISILFFLALLIWYGFER
jgi:hypothetical protein